MRKAAKSEAVKRGIARQHEIAPYKVVGPVRLNLLDSDNHVPPLHYCGKTITRNTVSEAFVDYYLENIENFPGYCHNLKDMDGFMLHAFLRVHQLQAVLLFLLVLRVLIRILSRS